MSKEPESWKEVTAEMLVKLPRAAIAAWAGRCAMRAQPLIRPDSFGPTPLHEAASHIETLDIAATLALVTFPTDPYIAGTIIAAATNATEDTLENPAYAAASAANSAALTINSTNTVDAAKNAMSAYDYATNAISQNASIKLPAAIVDYEYLILSSNAKDLKIFNTQPLWHSGETASWLSIVEKWGGDLDFLDSPFPDLLGIYNRHMKMIEGIGVDYNDARVRIDRWLDRKDPIRSKGDKRDNSEDSPKIEEQDEQSEDPVEQSIETSAIDRGGAATAAHDKSTTKDLLDREPLVQSLAAVFAAKEQATPFTLALLGDWGAGKSSVMDQLVKELKSGKYGNAELDFLFADFNAWQYEHTDNIRAGLAQEVINGLTNDLKFRIKPLRGILKRIALAFLRRPWLRIEFACVEYPWVLLKALIGLAVVIFLATSFWNDLWDSLFTSTFGKELARTSALGSAIGLAIYLWKIYKPVFDHPLTTKLQTYFKLPNYGKHLGIIPVMKKHIKLICHLRGVKEENPTKRLVIFVDDLDRCGHKCIIETLDAIRLVMDIPNVIVVIAIDSRIAFAAVANHYAELVGDRTKKEIARDYLGKIIQLPVNLHQPNNMDNFIRERLFATADRAEIERLAGDKKYQSSEEMLQWMDATYAKETEMNLAEEHIETKAQPDESLQSVEAIQRSKDDDKIVRLMLERPSDCRFFEKWTRSFKFTNPRQLIRLRNAYRLLTHLEHARSTETLDNQRMAMLFWLEFLHQKNAKEQKQYEDLLITPEDWVAGEPQTKDQVEMDSEINHKGIRAPLCDDLGVDIEDQRINYDKLKASVSRFVLP